MMTPDDRHRGRIDGGPFVLCSEGANGVADQETIMVIHGDTTLVLSGDSLHIWSERLGKRYAVIPNARLYLNRVITDAHVANSLECNDALDWAFIIELCERAGARLYGPDETLVLAQLSEHFDHIRATFRWCLRTGRFDLGSKILCSLVDELTIRERVEIASWASDVLDVLAEGQHPIRRIALAIAAHSALLEGQIREAGNLARESVEVERQLGLAAHWLSRCTLVFVNAAAGVPGQCAHVLEELEKISEDSDDPMAKAAALFDRVLLASFTDEPSSRLGVAEELIQLGTQRRSSTLLTMGLISLGRALARDEPDRARAALRQAEKLASLGRSVRLASEARRALIEIRNRSGDGSRMLGPLKGLLDEFEYVGDVSQQLLTLVSALDPLVRIGALDLAAVLCAGLSRTHLATAVQCRDACEASRNGLSAETFETCFEQGLAMSPRELVRCAAAGFDDLVGSN